MEKEEAVRKLYSQLTSASLSEKQVEVIRKKLQILREDKES